MGISLYKGGGDLKPLDDINFVYESTHHTTATPSYATPHSLTPLTPLRTTHPSSFISLFFTLLADFKDQYYSKIYRYDVKSFDHNPFPASKGYKMHLDSTGTPNPNTCCWLWLVDENGNNDKMSNFPQVPAKATDEGSSVVNGVTVEEWLSTSTFPFPQSGSYYFDNTSTLVQTNSFASVLGKGTIIGNTTYANFKAGPIPNATFAVPTSKPTFGKCKQCGVDPSCPMSDCMS